MDPSTPTTSDAIWVAVGNIVRLHAYGPGGADLKPGTKHFRAGARIYVIDAFWGTCDSVVVIGQHRKSRRFMRIAMRAKLIENLRPKLVYSPAVIRLIREHFAEREIPTKEDAERICQVVPTWPG
jgi:hypothetical protein